MAQRAPQDPAAKNRTAWKDWLPDHHDTYPTISTKHADLSGLSVFISGASKGVGRNAAASFAAAGASRIAIGARSDLAETEADMRAAAKVAGRPEPQILAIKLDVSSDDSVRAAAAQIESAFGGSLDVLVNNAGYLETWRPLAESDPADWWRSWEVNIKGPYLCVHHLLPLLQRASAAHSPRLVVNMSSIGALNVRPSASAYQGARFAICRFNEFLDAEYGPAARGKDGVVAVAMHPGGLKTELALNMPAELHAMLIDEPALPADFLVWLARERREWLSGRLVSATWDVDGLEAKKQEVVDQDLLKFRLML